ncbi:MAG: hypothetical protein C7B46_13755 [Sulfobacillus benefaciens]|uniref:HTH gntR-type domain-containing protein n=1 Tax=Sulfobacillus benefaciens TaxID=453960 RepID=A0A2T2XDJ2_9FIRM|nr:MAG: hypothetical protein C7B46_13755 [Sulfobacillus benefaciens]
MVLDQEALSSQIYRIIKDRITSDLLKPGDRLSVEELAIEFGVSRSPVKTAIDLLRDEGLVAIARNRGTFVNTLSEQDVLDILGVREMMEQYAAEIIPLPVTDHIALELREILAEERQLLDTLSDDASFLRRNELNALFHELLVEAAGNRHLTALYRKLNVRRVILRSYRVRPLRKPHDVHQEHLRILEAAEGTDHAALKDAVTTHTSQAREAFLHSVHPSQDPRHDSLG